MNVIKMNHAIVCDYKVRSYKIYADILALRPVRNAHCPAREKGIIAATA